MDTISSPEQVKAGEVSAPPGSRLREQIALAFTVLSLGAVTAVHLPWLPLEVQAVGHSFTNLVGQEHRWNMFSADPRGTSVDLWATIEYTDGSTNRWSIDRGVFGGDFRFYRIVKWVESAVLEPDERIDQFARWLVSTSPKPVAHVVVYGLQHPPGPPGQARPAPEVAVLADHVVADGEQGTGSNG